MPQNYKRRLQIRFREADPAQIMYFGNIFSLAHDTFEEFIQANGFTWNEWFTGSGPVIVPIRRAECDYLNPFRPGEFYDVFVSVAQIRQTSLQMKYTFKQDDRVHAVVHMVHAFLDTKTKEKTAVPESIRHRLQPFLEEST